MISKMMMMLETKFIHKMTKFKLMKYNKNKMNKTKGAYQLI